MNPPAAPLAAISLFLVLLAGCGGGDGIVLPGESEPAAIAVLRGDDQQGRVGERLTRPLVVEVTDSRDRPVEGATVAFEFGSAGAGAAVVPLERITDGDGLAAAELVLGTSIGRQTGQARVVLEGGRGPIQASFSALALPENANSMAAVSGQDQIGHVGLPLTDRLVVEVTDGFGNPVPRVPISWVAGGGGSVSEAVVETDEDGRSRVDRILGPTVGQQTTVASSEGLVGSPVTFVHTALAGDASRLVIISGNDQTAGVGSTLPADLVVQLIDADGNGVPQTAVSWVVATGGGTASPENSTTDGDGRTSARWTLGATLGQQRLDAVVSGIGIASFQATATAVAPPSLFIRTQPSASARNGVPLTTQPVVQLRDSQGNDVAQAGVQVTAAIGSGGGELGGTRQVSTDASGQARFTNLSISGAPGPRTLIFTAAGYAQATSSEIEVVAIATVTTITADSPDPSAAGSTFPVQVRVASEGPTPTGTVTVTVSGGTPTCTATLSGGAGSCPLTLNIVGDRTLTAVYSGVPGLLGSSDTEPHRVVATPPPPPASTVTTITSDSPDPSVSGSTFSVSFQVASSAGTPTGSVTVSVSGGTPTCTGNLSGGAGSCQLTLNIVGDRTLTATYSGAPGFSSSSDTEGHRVDATEPPPPASTVTTITGDSPDPTVSGTTFTVSFQVTSGGGTPTGSVSVSVSGGTPTCTGNLSGGSGSCQLTLNTVGDRTLTATYSGAPGFSSSSDTEPHTVTPVPPSNEPPDADFRWDCDDLTCHFTDESEDPDGDETITSRSWNFGDGTPVSNEVNPSHTYGTAGDYRVTLRVTDDGGLTDEDSDTVDPEAPPPPNQAPTAAFTWRCDDRECEFEDESSDSDGRVEEHAWTFGDGESSDDDDPDHRYSTGGTYQVTLTVTDNDEATGSVTHSVTVTEPPPPNQEPTAAFTESCSDLACSFNSAGSSDPDGTIVSHSWNFGDGNTSSEPNPNHTYAESGTYSVTLRVEDDDDATDDETHQVTVTLPPPPNEPPTAAFSPPGCTTNEPCQFTDGSSDSDGTIDGWAWNFGDGSAIDPSQHPTHVFTLAGSYTVTLTVTDDNGDTGETSQGVTVTDPPPPAP